MTSAHKPAWWHSMFFAKKYIYSSLFLTVSSASKKIRALEISIKLSSLTGMDGSLFRKTFIQYVKMWLTSRGGPWASFDILQNHKKPERRAPGWGHKAEWIRCRGHWQLLKGFVNILSVSLHSCVGTWERNIVQTRGMNHSLPTVHDISHLSSLAIRFFFTKMPHHCFPINTRSASELPTLPWHTLAKRLNELSGELYLHIYRDCYPQQNNYSRSVS